MLIIYFTLTVLFTVVMFTIMLKEHEVICMMKKNIKQRLLLILWN